MMMYDMSRQYHAERIMSAAEQRRAARPFRLMVGQRPGYAR